MSRKVAEGSLSSKVSTPSGIEGSSDATRITQNLCHTLKGKRAPANQF